MKSKKNISRRSFLQQTAVAAGVFGAAPLIMTKASGQIAANDRINVAAVGINGRGRYVMSAFMQQPDAQVVAVCDIMRDRRENARNMVNNFYGNEDCTAYIDMREMLEREDIDAVMIATGDNNHALCSILAARAGKDIFCEKPMSVAANESRAVVDTVNRFARIYQCGTQRRNVSNFVFAHDLCRSGMLGEIETMYAEKAWPESGVHFQVLEPQPEPEYEELAWDLWLGNAPWRPFNMEYTGGFWRRHGDFSGGSITEWGSHTVDLCQWCFDADDTAPVHYEMINELGDVECTYENGTKLIIKKGLRFGSCPIRIEGTEGWMETGDSGDMETYPSSLLANRRFAGGYPADNHVGEFLSCVRTRQQPRSNAEASHYSMLACIAANVSVRLQRPVTLDPKNEVFPDDPEATRLLSRAFREPWII